ncbi:MAG: hypothetical protein IRY95_08845 [Clostridia bacterium]|nr:hypothetical protein [Clostridia bacterium]
MREGLEYRSVLAEAWCPYVEARVMGYKTYAVLVDPAGTGRADATLVRADCLHLDTCPDLGCLRAANPFEEPHWRCRAG